jgi:alkanesulfonate monooxygenase SsuD/methylene tetrahydromethanopterin reductase-like flavin-dependent oxidoreductase (luciferase family)
MKASLFCTARYMGAAPHDIWPLSGEYYSGDAAVRSMQTTFDQFRCADEFGFDWVTVAEHHYSAFSLSPNPMVMAGALSQIVRRARIAVLGPTLPILNPVRVAEEFAMLDTMSGGRLVAGMMRGTPNEYVTYNVNPAESRERFAEALHLIRRAWTETRLARPLLPVPYHLDLAAACAAAAPAPLHVRLEPRGRGVRRAQPPRHRLRLHDRAACQERRAALPRLRPRRRLGAGGGGRHLPRHVPCRRHPTRRPLPR